MDTAPAVEEEGEIRNLSEILWAYKFRSLMTPSQNPIKILFIASVLLLVYTITSLIINTNRAMEKTADFMSRKFSGVLVEVKGLRRGSSTLAIKQYQTGEIFEYELDIGKFIHENNIGARDSISKEAHSGVVTFYKADEHGVYAKCCELQY